MAEERVQDEQRIEDEEVRPDPELEARRIAAMSFIHRYGDPVLKSRATPVDRFDEALRAQVARMGGIMNDAMGVGLAAPQLGVSQRLLVYRVGQDAPLIALANPELEWSSEDEEPAEEGCLSIP
ncbi:MAG: peptide deformylase, partial [Thermoleophilaceae bacterium]